MTEVIASIMRAEPEWNALPASLPPVMAVYLRRCLQKNPNDRVQDIGDLKLALEGAFDVPVTAGAATTIRRNSCRPFRRSIGLAALAAVAVGVKPVAGSAGRHAAAIRRCRVARPTGDCEHEYRLAISPDGLAIAFLAGIGPGRAIYVRPIEYVGGDPLRQVARAFEPFFSPDNRWIAYNDESDYTLRKISCRWRAANTDRAKQA